MINLSYGYRSKCCYAPIRLGRRKVKNSTLKINVWVCCKCKKRDVALVEYNRDGPAQSTQTLNDKGKFAEDDEPIQD